MTYIYDRTIKDVTEAQRIRTEKFLRGLELTEKELEVMAKGSFGIEDVQRVENGIGELSKQLNERGYYFQTEIETETFNQNSVLYKQKFELWCELVLKMRKAFLPYADTPAVVFNRFDYREINKIEKILEDIEKRIIEIKSLYRVCGKYRCGG